MKKTKIFKRLLTLGLALTVVICMPSVTSFAEEVNEVELEVTGADVVDREETSTEMDPNTIIISDSEGNITGYKTQEEVSSLATSDGVATSNGLIVSLDGDREVDIGNEGVISPRANSKMQKVNIFSITQAPYRTICFIYATFPDGKSFGSTGTLVGSNVVLASGHGICDPDHGGMATKITVSPEFYHNDDGQHYPFGIAQSTSRWMASGWQNDFKPEYDWSLICLNKSFPYTQSYGYAPNYSDLINRKIRAIGYIQEVPPPNEVWNMYTATGTLTGASERQIQYTISVQDGNSGGPIIDEATGAVIGVINNTTYEPFETNNAVRINEWLNGIITQCVNSNK